MKSNEKQERNAGTKTGSPLPPRQICMGACRRIIPEAENEMQPWLIDGRGRKVDEYEYTNGNE